MLVRLCAAVLMVVLALEASAQAYPSKPVRIVVPFAAGGAVDLLARLTAAKMAEGFGQPVVVENRVGAGGNLGTDVVAKAAADGHTILLTTNGLAISPALYKKLPFDAARDFVPVTQLVASHLLLVASPKFPVASAAELISAAKAKPGQLNYGSTGVGNPLHLTMELLKLSAGIDLVAVPYQGDAPLNTALMSGQVEVAIVPFSTALPLIKAGRIRALAVASARRVPALPDVPTIAEGPLPGFESSSWQGFFVPAKTPRDAVDAIHRETVKALNAADVRERLAAIGVDIVGSTPAEFEARFKDDLARFAKIVREAHIPQQD
jgi:tripartite-type tricarboxylate transporter receptor subunit TctC